ncbi:hypothetical protein CAOG_02091 [Capsaspora owczarzaki ATCC 30864]|uniref:hypothetical protein n=1 Tax=Capsaspora owczarzaki (strain ATCC 30864) TaxID=595528 RepID=UPI0001FE692C|nr:hypothetical protein CAOG_02091 [Capsaspora owczarzaki ATCC 30864]|eukprot:XP_004348841.1 hypothetical protein CAOG_02091 [Capsaspora owczarzaki ATCC 30864]
MWRWKFADRPTGPFATGSLPFSVKHDARAASTSSGSGGEHHHTKSPGARRCQPGPLLTSLLLVWLVLGLVYGEVYRTWIHVRQCDWPQPADHFATFKNVSTLRVMVVTSPRLPAAARWDADRFFSDTIAAVGLHSPDVILLLGDVFHEHEAQVSDEEFEDNHQRLMHVLKRHGKAQILIVPRSSEIDSNLGSHPSETHRLESRYGALNRAVTIGRVTFVMFDALAGRDTESSASSFLHRYGQSKLAASRRVEQKRRELLQTRLDKLSRMGTDRREANFRPNDMEYETRNAEIILSHHALTQLDAGAQATIVSWIQPDLVLGGHADTAALFRHMAATVPGQGQIVTTAFNSATPQGADGGSQTKHQQYGYADFLHGKQAMRAAHADFSLVDTKDVFVVPEITVPPLVTDRSMARPGFSLVQIDVADYDESVLEYVSRDASPEELTAGWPRLGGQLRPSQNWRFTAVHAAHTLCMLPPRLPLLQLYAFAFIPLLVYAATVFALGCGRVVQSRIFKRD